MSFEQEIDVKAGGGHNVTIGEMLRTWLTKLEWYSTLFPRIPVPIQKVKLGTFWLIWLINQRALYNHALSVVRHRR